MGNKLTIDKNFLGWFIIGFVVSVLALGYLTSAFASPFTFCWTEASGDVELYRVEVTDQFGQVVISTTTIDNCFSFDYEGALSMSVTAISSQGEFGPYSEWSDLEMSNVYKTMVLGTASNLEITPLRFVSAWVGEVTATWADPHENK